MQAKSHSREVADTVVVVVVVVTVLLTRPVTISFKSHTLQGVRLTSINPRPFSPYASPSTTDHVLSVNDVHYRLYTTSPRAFD